MRLDRPKVIRQTKAPWPSRSWQVEYMQVTTPYKKIKAKTIMPSSRSMEVYRHLNNLKILTIRRSWTVHIWATVIVTETFLKMTIFHSIVMMSDHTINIRRFRIVLAHQLWTDKNPTILYSRVPFLRIRVPQFLQIVAVINTRWNKRHHSTRKTYRQKKEVLKSK